jgi:hypothetical protein
MRAVKNNLPTPWASEEFVFGSLPMHRDSLTESGASQIPREWPGRSSSARVERAHSYRARSARRRTTGPCLSLLADLANGLLE